MYRTPGRLSIYEDTSNPSEDDDYYYTEAFVYEIFMAMAFTIVYMSQTVPKTWLCPDPGMQVLVISAAYSSLLIISSDITGESINPAYACAHNFVDLFKTGEREAVNFIWGYTIAPIIGAFLGFFVHQYMMWTWNDKYPGTIMDGMERHRTYKDK